MVALTLAACGGGDSDSAAFPKSSDPSAPIPAGERREINIVIASSDLYVGTNNFAFGITDKDDNPQGGAKAVVTFYDLKDRNNPKAVFEAEAVQSAPGVGPKVVHVHRGGENHLHGGEDDNRVGYYVKVTFDHAGLLGWGASVKATLKDGTQGEANVGFSVAERPSVVAPGMKAPKTDNLTRRDVLDIREIDSGDPPNDMHDVKIKDAIGAGRPVVIVFATPAFCTSRFCGPVTEEVESLQTDYKDRVDFVHIEIWRNFETRTLNGALKDWIVRADGGLSEPWVYVVDKNGTVYDRFEGPAARNIIEVSVKAVADGKTYGQ